MKKFLLTLLAVSLLVIPFRVEAGTKKVLGESYNTKNFVEALEGGADYVAMITSPGICRLGEYGKCI